MSDFVLNATLRDKTGRSEARRLRRGGQLPAVLYGGDKPELPLALDMRSTSKLLNDEHFYTSMIEIKIKGGRGKNTALLKDVQWDPVRDEPLHIDFHRVSSSDIVLVEIPIHARHFEKCPGVVRGGIVETIRHTVEVECRADSIPEAFELDCSKLDIGDSIHARDLALPAGVTIPEAEEHDFAILTLTPPTVEPVEGAAPAEVAEAGEEAGGEGE